MLAVMVNSSPLDAEAVAEHVEDRAGQPLRPRRVVAGVAHHQEFVAAEARDQAFGADRALDALRGAGDQQSSPAAWPSTSLTTLKRSRSMYSTATPDCARILQPRIEFAQHRVAVEQAGQRIGARLHAQGFLGLLAFGDVLQRAGHARADRVAGLGFADDAHPHRMAVGAGALQFEFELRRRAPARALQRVVEAAAFGFAQAAPASAAIVTDALAQAERCAALRR